MDDGLSYRSAVRPNFADEPKSSVKDEQDYSTLKAVQGILDQNLFDLEKNFNTFAVLNRPDKEQAAKDLLVDIEARQLAYSIIANVKEAVDSAISRVNSINSNN